MTVDFATYCCEKDIDKCHESIDKHVESHNYRFDNVYLIHQRIPSHGLIINYKNFKAYQLEIQRSHYSNILRSYNINPDNPEADKYTHGPTGKHYWKNHCVNHLVALRESCSKYIVLSDGDCYIKTQAGNWIEDGIRILETNKDCLLVSPGDGSNMKKTQIMSQQLFLCDRERLAGIDFDLPFTGFKDGGPFPEYYFMLEGRIARYMEKHGLYRYFVNRARYWHNQW